MINRSSLLITLPNRFRNFINFSLSIYLCESSFVVTQVDSDELMGPPSMTVPYHYRTLLLDGHIPD